MRKLSLDEIKAMPATDIVNGLRGRQFSLLQSLGFHKMRAEMNFTGFVCWAIIALTGLRKEASPETPRTMNLKSKGRRKVEKILERAAPCTLKGDPPHFECGTVFGFNHPSLGEILRFILICVKKYHDRVNLFPVNLPWFEAIMPIVHDLEKIGIYVMPIITPSTRSKMAKKADSNTMEVVDSLSNELKTLYLQKCVEFIKAGDSIWVAPSATRQKTVFRSVGCKNGEVAIEPQTMTLLALTLKRYKITDCNFQVIGVMPPEDFGRGLNLFRTYNLGMGSSISMESAIGAARERMPCGGSRFEFDFLSNIASTVSGLKGKNIVIPGPTDEV